jgi:serine/threonine-protein kinase
MVLRQHLTEKPVSLNQLVPGVPEAAAQAIERALAKAPEERWQSAGEMRKALLL